MSRIETKLFPFGSKDHETLIMKELIAEVKSFGFLTGSESLR